MDQATTQHAAPASAAAGRNRDIFLRISNHLARVTQIQSALAAVAKEVAQVLPFTHFDICLLDGPDWTVSYEVGIQTRWSRKRARLENSPVRSILCGDLDYMICTNAMEDPRQTFAGATSEPIFNHNLRSRVHVSMNVMGQRVGTLNISHSDQNRFDHDTLALAQPLADLLAPYFHALRAIEKARQDAQARTELQSREEGLRRGASSLTLALEQERQRIGMDLHDQTLADLTRLMRILTDETHPLDRSYLAEAMATSIRDLRQIIEEAMPAQLDLFGLSHALSAHLQKVAQTRAPRACDLRTSLVDNVDFEMDEMLPKDVRTAIYRIGQEAVNNAVNHAGASSIVITLDTDRAGDLVMCVRDDGIGFDTHGRTRRSGLAHMETRARLVRGHLDITSEHGTCVTFRLPLSAQEAPQ
ncbi:sensor histidine kinase [Celeribacter sp.]|uniref:sensor histidine kinase n=1 Tax=Celeribacter sp. TaxID=1890673 RepID=UPI003A94BF2F